MRIEGPKIPAKNRMFSAEDLWQSMHGLSLDVVVVAGQICPEIWNENSPSLPVATLAQEHVTSW